MSEKILTVVDAASNPKIATAVATATVSIGGASSLELFRSLIGDASLVIGFCTCVLVAAVQLIKLLRELRAYRNGDASPKD